MIRVGIGYDIHRLAHGRALILGGVRIPWPLGLTGHSDADVLLHAVMDALLGAGALGDIGHHFPPDDERYRGISSVQLLHNVAALLQARDLKVINIDVVVVAEEPRIAPHVHRMRDCIAAGLAIEPGAVSIKATTNEGVGPEGRQEAISARAVALIEMCNVSR